MRDLAALQRKYAKVSFDEIPDDDQYEIKHLQKQLNEFKPVFKSFEGNFNKMTRAFTLEKLSGFMSANQFQRKYLQTGEKQGKFLFKPDRHTSHNIIDDKKKSNKRQYHKNQIKSDLNE